MREKGDGEAGKPFDLLQQWSHRPVFDMHGDHVHGIVALLGRPTHHVDHVVLAGDGNNLLAMTLGNAN